MLVRSTQNEMAMSVNVWAPMLRGYRSVRDGAMGMALQAKVFAAEPHHLPFSPRFTWKRPKACELFSDLHTAWQACSHTHKDIP